MGNCVTKHKKRIYIHHCNFAPSTEDYESMDIQAVEENIVLVVIIGASSKVPDTKLLHQKYHHQQPGVYVYN